MYYFASDIHLGAGTTEQQLATERLFVQWLDRVAKDADAIFLCGDVFDFWFEYKRVVPKGFVRVLGKIATITDSGTRVVFMCGNHDMWVRDYFTKECGMEIYTSPTTFDIAGRSVHIAHGDNLNIKRSNITLRLMNGFFRSSFVRRAFSSLIHPNLAIRFGAWWSSSSRKGHREEDKSVMERSIGYLRAYAEEHYQREAADLYIFGHLHHAGDYSQETPAIIFMNDWSKAPHYIAIDKQGRAEFKSVK